MIITNRNNSRINYPQGYPGYLFAVVIYTAFENKGSEGFRKKLSENRVWTPQRMRPVYFKG
jgi:hypothetical protein